MHVQQYFIYFYLLHLFAPYLTLGLRLVAGLFQFQYYFNISTLQF